jgi:DNA (cytosine-5)-methyltransferase 1
MSDSARQPAIQLNAIDIFSGVGGFTCGFGMPMGGEKFAVKTRLMVDKDPEARRVVNTNFPDVPFHCGDLHKMSGKDIRRLAGMDAKETLHVLAGGPPCQGFSGLSQAPLEDSRNLLIGDYLRLVKDLRPLVTIMENVPQIITAHDGLIINDIIKALNQMGYNCVADILVASDYGVPQLRKRAVLLAYRSDLGVYPRPPKGTHERVEAAAQTVGDGQRPRFDDSKLPYISVEDAIGDLPPLQLGQEGEAMVAYPPAPKPLTRYQRWAREGSIALFNHKCRAHSDELTAKLQHIEEGGRNSELPEGIRFSNNYYSQAYARLHRNGIAQTITTHFGNPGSGRFTHYRDLRSITVREAARLQSFPDTFLLEGHHVTQMRHIGNAVPPLMARAIRDRIVEDLKDAAIDQPRPRGRPKTIEATPTAERSRVMGLIPSKNTRPELRLRKALWAVGVRGFRVHSDDVPGTPDIVFPINKLAIFVDGAFWHGHPGLCRMPKTNVEYWQKKIKRNKQRDREVNAECERNGWKVLRFWDSEIEKETDRCVADVTKCLKSKKGVAAKKVIISLEKEMKKLTKSLKIAEENLRPRAIIRKKSRKVAIGIVRKAARA